MSKERNIEQNLREWKDQNTIVIVIPIRFDIPPDSLYMEGGNCNHCNAPFKSILFDHKFQTGLLERIVPNTPVLQCECGTHIEDYAAKPIIEKDEQIAKYIKSQKKEVLLQLTEFLSPEDISKVVKYARISQKRLDRFYRERI